jgi:hypothetical protein
METTWKYNLTAVLFTVLSPTLFMNMMVIKTTIKRKAPSVTNEWLVLVHGRPWVRISVRRQKILTSDHSGVPKSLQANAGRVK